MEFWASLLDWGGKKKTNSKWKQNKEKKEVIFEKWRIYPVEKSHGYWSNLIKSNYSYLVYESHKESLKGGNSEMRIGKRKNKIKIFKRNVCRNKNHGKNQETDRKKEEQKDGN